MPEKFHDTATTGVILVGIDYPLADLDVVLSWSSVDLLPGHGELRTARRANLFRHLQEFLVFSFVVFILHRKAPGGVQRRGAGALKYLCKDFFRHVLVGAMALLAPRVPVAAEVDIAIVLDEVETQGFHRNDIVV